VYQFDLALLDDLEVFEAMIATVPAPGAEDPAPVLDRLQQAVRALDGEWKQRETVISNIVQTGSAGQGA
jgi:hypothetical protein